MHVTRIFTGADGESHFEEVEIPLVDRGAVGRISKLHTATGLVFRETDGQYDLALHNAPRRQFVVNLDGAVELESGTGEKRILAPGEILLAEDLTGRGHISRAVGAQARRSLFITLD